MIQKDLSVITSEEKNNELVLQCWKNKWILNAASNFAYVRPTETLERLIDKYKDYTAVIVGSGGSLDDNYEKLKKLDRSKTLILCVNSSLKTLIANQIIPDYVVAVDASDHIYKDFDNINTYLLKLIANTSVDPRTLSTWEGERYLFNMDQKGSDFLENTLHVMYSKYPQIQNAGCSVNSSVIIALMMGCRKIYLVGADFGYSDNKYRAKKYKIKEGLKEWEEVKIDHENEINKREVLFEKNGVRCLEEHTRYNISLVNLSKMTQFNDNWKLGNWEIVDCSKGIIDEFRKGDLGELL